MTVQPSLTVAASDDESGAYFAWDPCDVCHTTLGGDRVDMLAGAP